MYRLELRNVTKHYGREVALDNLSFAVETGRVTGFLGPNGAGKSTALKILLGLASADGGQANIGGKPYSNLETPARTVGVFLEPNAFHPGRSGRDHLLVIAAALGLGRQRVDEMLDVVGLTHAATRHVGTYSLGMRQRLGLAGSLLTDPPVLILDEPGNGLDPQGIHDLRDLLRARAANGCTVFVSSHLLAEVEHLADDLVVINRGKLVTAASLESLRSAVVRVRSPRSADLAPHLRAEGAQVRAAPDGHLVVERMSMDEIGEYACAAGIPLHELAEEPNSLEDLFLRWTGDEPTSPRVKRDKEASRR